MLDDPMSLPRPMPLPSPPQRQRSECYSRIPTSTKEHYPVLDKKTEITTRVVDNNREDKTYTTAHSCVARNYTASPLTTNTLNRHNSFKETKSSSELCNSNLRPSNSEISLGPHSLGPRSLSFTRTATENSRRRLENVVRDIAVSRNVEPEREPEPEFVPFATDRPVGLDLEEFLPRGAGTGMGRRGTRCGSAEPSEQEVLGVMMRGHDSMMTVLTARQRALQVSM
ncbi:hypothetical protein ACJJTC_014291 [Scirpophaga incertulas]